MTSWELQQYDQMLALPFNSSNACRYASSNLNYASFSNKLHNGFTIFLKILYESSVKSYMA